MEDASYNKAKSDLQSIFGSVEFITYDSSMKQIVFSQKGTNNDLRFDLNQLYIRIFIFLFIFIMLLIAGRNIISSGFIIYAGLIGLLMAIVSTLTKDITVLIDFSKGIIKRNNRTVKFADCRKVLVDQATVALIAPIYYTATIETSMGKLNLPVWGSSNEKEILMFAHWLKGYVIG